MKELTKNRIVAAKVTLRRQRDGNWANPNLVLGVISDFNVDAEGKVHVDQLDMTMSLPQGEAMNLPHEVKGIGPHLGLPDTIVKSDPSKQGRIFEFGSEFDEKTGARINRVAAPVFERYDAESKSWYTTDSLADADRVTVHLFCRFDRLCGNPAEFTRVARVRDDSADGGWRDATPWTQKRTRKVLINGKEYQAEVSHLSAIVLCGFEVDRDAIAVTPGVVSGVGEML